MKEIILKELVKNRSLDTCNDFVLWADISDLEVLADKIEKAITVIHFCKSDSEQLKAFNNDETVALDGTLEVKIINIESNILVQVIEDNTLMWVKKDRIKKEYSF